MNKSPKTKIILIISAIAVVLAMWFFLVPSVIENYFQQLRQSVPDNPDFPIPTELKPEEIISKDLGGDNYSELTYDKSLDGQKWLVPCFTAIGTDDAGDVCKGFARGYLRKYSAYKLPDGTIAEGEYRINMSTDILNTDGEWTTIMYDNEKLKGAYSLLLNIIEYDTPDDAKYACSFLVIDSSYETTETNGASVMIKESKENDWGHYVLPAGKTVISAEGNLTAVKNAMGTIVREYKK